MALIPADLREPLLSWWADHGRHTIPWKLCAGGIRPRPADQFDPYPIWTAEVNRR